MFNLYKNIGQGIVYEGLVELFREDKIFEKLLFLMVKA